MTRRHPFESSNDFLPEIYDAQPGKKIARPTPLTKRLEEWKVLADGLLDQMGAADRSSSSPLLNLIPAGLRSRLGIDDSPVNVIDRHIEKIERSFTELTGDIAQIVSSAQAQIATHHEISELVTNLKANPNDEQSFARLEELIRGSDDDYPSANPEAEKIIASVRQRVRETKGQARLTEELVQQAQRAQKLNQPTITLAQTATIQAALLTDQLRADRQLLLTIVPSLHSTYRGAQDILTASKLNVTNDQFVTDRLNHIVSALELAGAAFKLAQEKNLQKTDADSSLADITRRAQRLFDGQLSPKRITPPTGGPQSPK